MNPQVEALREATIAESNPWTTDFVYERIAVDERRYVERAYSYSDCKVKVVPVEHLTAALQFIEQQHEALVECHKVLGRDLSIDFMLNGGVTSMPEKANAQIVAGLAITTYEETTK